MNGDHPTMGDYAYGMAQGQQGQIERLSRKVEVLEDHADFLTDVINALLDRMYGPDDSRKPSSIRKLAEEYELRVRGLG